MDRTLSHTIKNQLGSTVLPWLLEMREYKNSPTRGLDIVIEGWFFNLNGYYAPSTDEVRFSLRLRRPDDSSRQVFVDRSWKDTIDWAARMRAAAPPVDDEMSTPITTPANYGNW